MEEKISQIIRDNINKNNINYIDNIDYLTCQDCGKLNIKAKICKRCIKSLCFFCQKNHDCFISSNNAENWEIDNNSRELIRKITIICPECQTEIEYSRASSHIQICLQGKGFLNRNRNALHIQDINEVPISNSRENITNINSNKESTKFLCCVFKNCMCESCECCKCTQCECKSCCQCSDCECLCDGKECFENFSNLCQCSDCERHCQCSDCESLCDGKKGCFENVSNQNIQLSLLLISTLKLILGIVFAGIIVANLPSMRDYVDKGKWETEKDEMKNISNRDIGGAAAYFSVCLTGGLIGYFVFFLNRKKNWGFGLGCLMVPDIIIGDLALTICIPSHRKTIINNLTTYPNQKLMTILNDSYNKIYSSQWAIFSIKMILLFILLILLFYYLARRSKSN